MKKVFKIIALVMVAATLVLCLCSCQGAARNYGGTMTLELPANEKLVLITWKDDSLWYLTKPMTETDVAETYTFQQSSEWGVFEGTVFVVESKN